MIVLWDSTGATVNMSLVDSSGKCNNYAWQAGRKLAQEMLSYIRDCLAEHNATFADITGIGIRRGPGSFTGLRIGLTVLNTLANEQRIPIVGHVGDDWQKVCLNRLGDGQNDKLVLPEYGGEAHITTPRK